MPDPTRVQQLLEAFEDVEMAITYLHSDVDQFSDEQDDGRFLRSVNHLAETCDAITAARNAFRDAAAL